MENKNIIVCNQNNKNSDKFLNFASIEERISVCDNLLNNIRNELLGFNLNLDKYVSFTTPNHYHLTSFLSFANKLALLGYECNEDWDVRTQNCFKYFMICALAYCQAEKPKETITFSDIIDLSEELENSIDFFPLIMQSCLDTIIIPYYDKFLSLYDECIDNMFLYCNQIFSLFLMKNFDKETLENDFNDLYDDIESLLIN